jgi:RiboL-PSP-HEPN
MAAARAVARESFIPRALASAQSNPNSETVKRMFNAVGRSRVFEVRLEFEKLWGGPVATTYCEDTLDALVISRNKVAHTADAAHVSRSDLDRNVRFIETFAKVLAADLAQHITTVIGEATALQSSTP